MDYKQVCAKLAERLRERGCEIRTELRVHGLIEQPGTVTVRTDGEELEAQVVVNCAGLHSDRVAKLGNNPAPAGVRAQAITPDGKLLDAFAFSETRRIVHVVNAPSPAATASLNIGEFIAGKVAERFLGIDGGRPSAVSGRLLQPLSSAILRPRRYVMSAVANDLVERALAAAEPAERPLRRQLLDLLLAPSGPARMTYEEFLAWADEDTLAEWVDGEVIMTSPASVAHQDLAGLLNSVLRAFVEQNKLGLVLAAPFLMRLEGSSREPDLLFLAGAHLDRLRKADMDGPADLVVEIISPESVGRDRGEKFYEYEQAGIPEYWLLDPQTRRAEFYQLGSEGQYHLTAPDKEGVYRSTVLPGFWLRVDWLWQRPLPRMLDVLRELGVV